MPRYHVTVPMGAVVTLNRVYEIEAANAAEAKGLIDRDEAWELADDQFFPVGDDEIVEIHSSEIEPDALTRMTAKLVGKDGQ